MSNDSPSWQRRATELWDIVQSLDDIEAEHVPAPYARAVRERTELRHGVLYVAEPEVSILARRDTRSWRKAAEQLWMILDDIEALSGAMQPRETEYYRRVMELVLRRHDVLVLEGA